MLSYCEWNEIPVTAHNAVGRSKEISEGTSGRGLAKLQNVSIFLSLPSFIFAFHLFLGFSGSHLRLLQWVDWNQLGYPEPEGSVWEVFSQSAVARPLNSIDIVGRTLINRQRNLQLPEPSRR